MTAQRKRRGRAPGTLIRYALRSLENGRTLYSRSNVNGGVWLEANQHLLRAGALIRELRAALKKGRDR